MEGNPVMSTTRTKTLDTKTRREITSLWLRRPLRPIRNDADLEEAIAVAESLDRKKRLSLFEKDYL